MPSTVICRGQLSMQEQRYKWFLKKSKFVTSSDDPSSLVDVHYSDKNLFLETDPHKSLSFRLAPQYLCHRPSLRAGDAIFIAYLAIIQ